HQDVVVTLSTLGYVKRLPLDTYRAQRRGGRGITGMKTREDDAVRHLLVTDTHDSLLFFTDRGRCFQIKAYELPDAARTARGIPLINLVSVDQREWVTAVVRLPKDLARDYMVMGTKVGEVKKTPLKYFANVRRGGLNAMDLEAADELVSVKLAGDEDHAMVITAQGKSLRFSVGALRSASRQSGGVRGVRLAKGDRVVALDIARPDEAMLVVTSQGFGKRTPVADYPLQGRGGQGVITFKTTPKTGELVSARLVNPSQELMLISTNGIVLRTAVEQISLQGRPTQGVTLMDVEEGETVAAVTVIDMAKDYRGEAPLPTGVSAEPGAAGAPKKARTRAKAPVAGKKAAPKAPAAKGKAAPAKAKAPAAKAPAKKPASPPKAQASRPASRPTRPGGGPQRKSPPRGR
ncbi:MAG: DNA gyrase C-terminal beta-propeller domain-containing protein, partial [Dehalococcoidia bacterium]|nr:DNA gyrase C-terminal beta-propeller domain-containing protein [Dehalococcoidia bacterium]